MKIISWNIDSINAALTSDSNRAKMSREVLATILKEDPDIIAIQETKLPKNGPSKNTRKLWQICSPITTMFLFHQKNQLVRVMLATWLLQEGSRTSSDFPKN